MVENLDLIVRGGIVVSEGESHTRQTLVSRME